MDLARIPTAVVPDPSAIIWIIIVIIRIIGRDRFGVRKKSPRG